MNREKTVLGLLEVLELLITRCLRKLAVQTVRPAVVLAGEDLCVATVFLDDGVCAVSAYVVECVNLARSVLGNNNVVVGDVVAEEVAGVCES